MLIFVGKYTVRPMESMGPRVKPMGKGVRR